MKRDLNKISQTVFDVLVIGGGIHGAFVALDAAQRGLSVALVEKGDFGSATSSNSLKTVHGGLRYLQDLDLDLVQKMIFERKTYLRIAPHLVHPLPFVVPTIKKLSRSYTAMRVALGLNDFFGRQRNVDQVVGKELPGSRMLTKAECLDYLPGLKANEITGGALWYDAQIYNTERFLLNVLKSAVGFGAQIANYVSAKQITTKNGHVTGARLEDTFTGERFIVEAKQIVNATGAWIDRLIVDSDFPVTEKLNYPLTAAWNVVTRKFINHCAAGIFGKNNKLLFVAPWRSYSIAGTVHEAIEGTPESYNLPIEKVQAFIDEINATYPASALTLEDVCSIHKGFHHVKSVSKQPNKGIKALRRAVVHDHVTDHALDGLLTIVSVKFTTARAVAEKTVDIICQKAELPNRSCQTHLTPIYGGDISDFNEFTRAVADIDLSVAYGYGSAYKEVFDSTVAHKDQDADALFSAQVTHAVRHEMAFELSDVFFRRTDIGSGQTPSMQKVELCSELMARELGWTDHKKHLAIDQFTDQLGKRWPLAQREAPLLT